MATHISPAFKYRVNSTYSRSMQLRRGKGRVKTKKTQKKIRLKFKHIFLYLFFLGGIFFFIQQSYLFLISWDKLDVKEIKIDCRSPELKDAVRQFFNGKKIGNILLLDISQLQGTLTAHRWIKEARVRKIFPSSLKIEIKERTPAAILQKEYLFLIDEEGVQLEKTLSREKVNLPLLVDSNNFEKDYKEKLKLAWECLSSFSLLEKEQIESLDLSDYGNVTIQLKENHTRLILGSDQFSQKLRFFQAYSAKLAQFGPLDYVDLRFQDRLYIKRQKSFKDINFNPEKEAK